MTSTDLTALLILILILTGISIVLSLLVLLRSGGSGDFGKLLTGMKTRLDEIPEMIRSENARMRSETSERLRENRQELSAVLASISQLMSQQGAETAEAQARFLSELMEQIQILRSQLDASARASRREMAESQSAFENKLRADTASLTELHRSQFQELREEQRRAQHAQTETLEKIRQENAVRLEEMRRTVDEKLQQTVEKRFDSSFRVINDQLEQVHKGLGEMQQLAAGVGDLKRVLTNVKTRGTFGEIQLGTILDQFLSPDQYVRNAHVVPGSAKNVEFAVRLPGGTGTGPVLLPIDSKFPVEAYQRLTDAREDPDGAEKAQKAAQSLDSEVRRCAKDIRDKYIHPPYTTDFAILFVPSEGIYAEVLQRPGLTDQLQQTYHVTVVGPTNLVAFLSSLQMGFRTLAIEKRSSEVWELLGAVKTEFGKFGDVLAKTKKKLTEAANVMESVGTRTRAIERKLKDVEALPLQPASGVQGLTEEADPEDT